MASHYQGLVPWRSCATGGVVIWICVTLLKYFHELVEASRALLAR